MSKSVLVIDTPKHCSDCSIRFTDEYSDYCPCNKQDVFTYVHTNTKPDWCPLSSLPERINLCQYVENGVLDMDGILAYQYAQGWNDCLQEIQNNI